MQSIDVLISNKKLNVELCSKFVEGPSCGAINLFVGTVRKQTNNKEVTKLEFSSYKPMALKEMQKIAEKALERFEISKIAIHHFEGTLQIGEIPVIIAVSSAHRSAGFEACRYAIDTLKETVPIWKKEFFIDGSVWVNARP